MATVLVVDDRPVNRDLVRTVLAHYGHETLEACDGAEALALLQRRHPDLVLTDVGIAGMGGYQLAREIRSDPVSKGIAVIFYTANYLAQEARPTASLQGVSSMAPKTGVLSALIEAVDDALLEAC